MPYESIPSKFELALKEECPDLYEGLIKFVRDAELNDFAVRFFVLINTFKILEDLYDKEGRAGLRNFEKTRVLAKDAHENAHGN